MHNISTDAIIVLVISNKIKKHETGLNKGRQISIVAGWRAGSHRRLWPQRLSVRASVARKTLFLLAWSRQQKAKDVIATTKIAAAGRVDNVYQFRHTISQSCVKFGPLTFWGSTKLVSRNKFTD